MKFLEYARVVFTLGLAAADAIREARRRGDTRPAKVIWDSVKTQRIAAEKYRENVERHRAQKRRLGLSEDE